MHQDVHKFWHFVGTAQEAQAGLRALQRSASTIWRSSRLMHQPACSRSARSLSEAQSSAGCIFSDEDAQPDTAKDEEPSPWPEASCAQTDTLLHLAPMGPNMRQLPCDTIPAKRRNLWQRRLGSVLLLHQPPANEASAPQIQRASSMQRGIACSNASVLGDEGASRLSAAQQFQQRASQILSDVRSSMAISIELSVRSAEHVLPADTMQLLDGAKVHTEAAVDEHATTHCSGLGAARAQVCIHVLCAHTCSCMYAGRHVLYALVQLAAKHTARIPPVALAPSHTILIMYAMCNAQSLLAGNCTHLPDGSGQCTDPLYRYSGANMTACMTQPSAAGR